VRNGEARGMGGKKQGIKLGSPENNMTPDIILKGRHTMMDNAHVYLYISISSIVVIYNGVGDCCLSSTQAYQALE